MEYINCILCNENNTEKILASRDFRYKTSEETFNIVKCKKCGLVYFNPRPIKQEIVNYYPFNYRPRETFKRGVIEKRIKKHKIKKAVLFF